MWKYHKERAPPGQVIERRVEGGVELAKEAIAILAFYISIGIVVVALIILAHPYYQEIGDCVSSLFRNFLDAINTSDDNGGNA